MKKLALILLVTCVTLNACKYDDSDLRDMIENHEDRISKLELLCSQMNTNVQSMEVLVKSLEQNDYITSVTPVELEGKTVGYTISFSKNSAITIYNGSDGQDGVDGSDGQDGVSPQISIKQDEDGKYYWTLNGAWIRVDGRKLQVEGQDGHTPKFEIREGYWYVSYNEGASWEKVGKATGENGSDGTNADPIFSKVIKDGKFVYFELADGTSIKIPAYQSDVICFEDNAVKAICLRNWDADLDGEISYSEIDTVTAITQEHNFKGNTLIQSFNELKYFKSLKVLSSSAFEDCCYLWRIEFPESLLRIEDRALWNCGFVYITLPTNLQYIEEAAIGGPLKSISIDFGSNVNMEMVKKSITFGPFPSSQLINRTIKANCNIPNKLFACIGNIEKFDFTSSVKTVGDEAFYYSHVPSELTIPESVEVLGIQSYSTPTPYSKIHLGKNIRIIKDRAFAVCGYYQSFSCEVYCEALTPPSLGSEVFYESNPSGYYDDIYVSKIYVPEESVEKYKEAWYHYKQYIQGYNFN